MFDHRLQRGLGGGVTRQMLALELPEHGPSVVHHDELGVRGLVPRDQPPAEGAQHGGLPAFGVAEDQHERIGLEIGVHDRQIGLVHAERQARPRPLGAGPGQARHLRVRQDLGQHPHRCRRHVADPGPPPPRQVVRGRCGRVRHPLGVDPSVQAGLVDQHVVAFAGEPPPRRGGHAHRRAAVDHRVGRIAES